MNTIFDTHCHPHLNKIKNPDETIKNFFENWWKYMTIVWTDIEKSKKVVELAKKYNWVFASIGIHPCDITNLDIEKTISKMRKLYGENKVKIVAIWECWLDYYWMYRDEETNKLEKNEREKLINEQKKEQEIFFKSQINLAKELDLPVIIHNRESKDDVLRILKETDFKNFIFHCYSEDLDYAVKLIEFSSECKISFSGIVTFKNAVDIQETAKKIPIKHILAETDSPYLTPTPYRWQEENEPLYTKYIVEKISELRWVDCSEEILKNSLEIFWIKK